MNELFRLLSGIVPFFLLISNYSAKFELDPFMVTAQIEAESSFRPKAVSPVGAIGLMQLMPSTAAWLGFIDDESEVDDLFSPNLNIKAGCYYDRWLINYWSKKNYPEIMATVLAICSYNAGAGRTKKAIINSNLNFNSLPKETQHYVKKILSRQVYYLYKTVDIDR